MSSELAFLVQRNRCKVISSLHGKKCMHVEKVFIRKDLSGHLYLYLQLCLSVEYRPQECRGCHQPQKLFGAAEPRRAINPYCTIRPCVAESQL